MATTQTKNGAPSINAAFEQTKEFNQQLLSSARQAGNLYVDAYEKAIDRATDFERKVGRLSQQEWLKNLIDVHVDMTREFADSYTTVARSLLK
jgi:hypothetical protein